MGMMVLQFIALSARDLMELLVGSFAGGLVCGGVTVVWVVLKFAGVQRERDRHFRG